MAPLFLSCISFLRSFSLMGTLWLTLSAVLLSLAWLLPNHSLPWLGFHGDAWTALMLLLVALFIAWRSAFRLVWTAPVAVAAAVAEEDGIRTRRPDHA